MNKRQTHDPALLIVIIVTFFGGLLGALIGAWVADFSFYSRLSLATQVVAVFAIGGVLAGILFGTILALTPGRDAKR